MQYYLTLLLSSCLAVYGHPPESTGPNFGASVTIHVDGYFHPVTDTGGQQFRDILRRAGISDDEELLEEGRKGLDRITEKFGISSSFVTNSSILHNPPKLNDSSEHWQFETGIMGPATNIHVLFESVRTKDGKVKLRKPQHSVRLSFAYLKLKCIAESCPRENNLHNVPQSTEVYVQWSVAQPEDLAKGYHHITKTENNFMFYLHAPKHPKQVYAMLDDKNTNYRSPLYGGATVIGRKGGVLNIDVTKAKPDVFPPQPRIKIWHVVTYPELLDELPDWAEPEDPANPVACYDHWSCLPAAETGGNPTRLHGLELSAYGNGYYYQINDSPTYRNVLKGANLKSDEEVLTWGRDALTYFQQKFSVPIPEGLKADDLILSNVQNVEVGSGQWLWQVGVLDSKYTGVQVTGIAFTNKRGKSKGFVPKDGKLTNAFIRATCQADTCTVGQDHVPRGTKLEAKWWVGDSRDGAVPPFETRSKEWYREWSYQEPDVVKGIVKDDVNIADYGICEGNGATLLDKENPYTSEGLTVWKSEMWYVMTCKDLLDELPPDPSPSSQQQDASPGRPPCCLFQSNCLCDE